MLTPCVPLCGLFYFYIFGLTLFILKLSLTQQTDIKVQVIRPKMTTKFEVEKLDGRNIFNLWCIKMCALLI